MFPDCQNLIGRETCLISPWLSSKVDYNHNPSSLQQALCSFYSSGMWLRHKHFRRGEVGKKKNWQKTTKLILLNCAAPCLGYFTVHWPAEIILIFPFWQWKPRRKERFLFPFPFSPFLIFVPSNGRLPWPHTEAVFPNLLPAACNLGAYSLKM